MSAATYPEAPGFKTTSPETSFDAAMDMLSNAATLRKQAERILSTFVDCTADEAAKFLGVSPLAMRPRFSELVKQGKAEDSGIRRKNDSGKSAVAWRQVRKIGQMTLL